MQRKPTVIPDPRLQGKIRYPDCFVHALLEGGAEDEMGIRGILSCGVPVREHQQGRKGFLPVTTGHEQGHATAGGGDRGAAA